jgi:hypothetical protein
MIDSYTVSVLYIIHSIGAGRVFRFAFDDEIFTLQLAAQPRTLGDLLPFAAEAADVHPQLSYVFYALLTILGLSDDAQRGVSLLISAAAAAIVHRTTMTALRLDGAGRLVAMMLFASAPLLVTYGDALRYIPLFTLFFALFLQRFLASERLTLSGAALLGLMLSTNLLGGVVAVCAALASLLRRGLAATATNWLKCGLVFIFFGAFGLRTLLALPPMWGAGQSENFGAPGLAAFGQSLLGFFGGFDLGPLQSPAIMPTALATGVALYVAVAERRYIFVALLYASVVALGLAGFSLSRAFAFVQLAGLAPILWALSAFQNRQWFAPLGALLICCQIFTFLPLRSNDRPFKRNLAIPYASLIASVDASIAGKTGVIESDPTLIFELKRRFGKRICLYRMMRKAACEDEPADTLIIVTGHHSNPRLEAAVADRLRQAFESFHAPAVSAFGVDADAALKQRLTGAAIEPAILKMHVFHRN